MPDPILSERDDDFLLAGELALGVLEGDERSRAQRKQLSDPEFAAAVDWWSVRLGAMAEGAGSIQPPSNILAAIHARIDALAGGGVPMATIDPAARRPAPWSIGLAVTGLTAAAAALALFLATPQTSGPQLDPASEQQGVRYVAQASDEASGRRLSGLIDRDNGRLSVTVAGLEPEEGRIAELWVVPGDGSPRSLGFLPAAGNVARDLSEAEQALLVEGAALAVTFEEDTGVPHEAPSLPIVLVTPLDRV